MHTQLSAAAILLLATGCGATVHSSVAPNTNLGQYKTYAFYRPPSTQGQAETIADQTITSALRAQLSAKGFTEATQGSPDFLVAHHVRLQQELQSGYGVGAGYYGGAYTYTVGTLIVDFVDPQTQKVFWRGTASDVVNNPSMPDPHRIESAVARLVNQYPVNLAAAQRPTM
jgi:hypothetical protein